MNTIQYCKRENISITEFRERKAQEQKAAAERINPLTSFKDYCIAHGAFTLAADLNDNPTYTEQMVGSWIGYMKRAGKQIIEQARAGEIPS